MPIYKPTKRPFGRGINQPDPWGTITITMVINHLGPSCDDPPSRIPPLAAAIHVYNSLGRPHLPVPIQTRYPSPGKKALFTAGWILDVSFPTWRINQKLKKRRKNTFELENCLGILV